MIDSRLGFDSPYYLLLLAILPLIWVAGDASDRTAHVAGLLSAHGEGQREKVSLVFVGVCESRKQWGGDLVRNERTDAAQLPGRGHTRLDAQAFEPDG